ncbi:MAG: hypothetical protein K2P93_01575 [Alphaproteobacteria bacterium]|nr:hypothetical protein [Alphaproteobacteria bacterium]
MLFKNFLAKILNKTPILAAAGFLFGTIFTNTTWAMEETIKDAHIAIPFKSHIQTYASFFSYDFNYLEEARQVVAHAHFLPEEIRSFFEKSAKTYDRKQFLKYFELQDNTQFLLNLDPENANILSEERLSLLDAESKLKFQKICLSEIKSIYEPYLTNIKYIIKINGRINTELFDSFLFHILGVGKAYSGWFSEEEANQRYSYSAYNITRLLQGLHEVQFLKNSDFGSLLSLKNSYSPADRLKCFNEKGKESISTLVIAGGHVGRVGIESITQYRNTLTIDLSPLQAPDIISDINNSDLLNGLVTYYRGALDYIYDTSNVSNFTIFCPETMECLAHLLRPGGQLISTNSLNQHKPIERTTANHLMEKYSFKPIYREEDVDSIIALEKQDAPF